MKIPKTVKIGGLIYTIEFTDIEKEKAQRDSIGLHHARFTKIIIDSRLSLEKQESIFLHEIIEALNLMYSLELEHKTIDILEAGLYQVLKDNKMVGRGFLHYIRKWLSQHT